MKKTFAQETILNWRWYLAFPLALTVLIISLLLMILFGAIHAASDLARWADEWLGDNILPLSKRLTKWAHGEDV